MELSSSTLVIFFFFSTVAFKPSEKAGHFASIRQITTVADSNTSMVSARNNFPFHKS